MVNQGVFGILDFMIGFLKNNIFIGIVIVIASFAGGVFAQNLNILQNTISSKSDEIQQIERELQKYQTELNATTAKTQTLKSAVATLDLNQKKLAKQKQLYQKKIALSTEKLVMNQRTILQLQNGISENTSTNGELIKQMAQLEQTSLPEYLLSNQPVSDFFDNSITMMQVIKKLRNTISTMRVQKTSIEQAQKELEKTTAELKQLQTELIDQEKIIEIEKQAKTKLLAESHNTESIYKKLVADTEKRIEALESEIRDYETKIKFILDEKSLPKPGSAVLSWPVEKPFITQLFGKTKDSKRLYASGSHSGVDFRGSVGTPIYAVASGIVEGTGDTDTICPKASFGKWVFIRHENGLATTYGHLSLIKAVAGSRVARGELIGYSGNTGHSTGPHLHITVYASHGVDGSDGARISEKPSTACAGKILRQPMAPISAYLDPMLYFPKI